MFFDILDIILKAWKRRSPALRWATVILCSAIALGFVAVLINQGFVHAPEEKAKVIYLSFFGVALLAYLSLKVAVDVEEKIEIKERVQRAETAVEEHPLETRPLWDLARTRLELYFERNLSQIKTIFWITVLIMVAGFVMIFYGIFRAFDSSNIQPSVVAAASGILTEFIAATFLVIYRSTMAQATEYVATLERINAVGMAIQIADSIGEKEVNLKNTVRAELAARILGAAPQKDLRRSARVTSIARKHGDQATNSQE